MNSRIGTAIAVASVTLVAVGTAITAEATPVLSLLLVAVGFPLSVFLMALAIADRERVSRPWPSFIIGATVIPVAVVIATGVITVAAMSILGPLAGTGWGMADLFGADLTLIGAFDSGWAVLFLVELAVVAPIVEEALKPLGAIIRRPASRIQAFSFGMAAGAGFAATENILYVGLAGGSVDSWIAVSLARAAGAGLHILGTGLVALAWHQLRTRQTSVRSFLTMFAAAIGIHAAWNGLIGVTVVLYWNRAIAGDLGSPLAWGVALQTLLFMFGVVIVAALILAARWVAGDNEGIAIAEFIRPGDARTVTVWAALGTALMVPMAILFLFFPAAATL